MNTSKKKISNPQKSYKRKTHRMCVSERRRTLLKQRKRNDMQHDLYEKKRRAAKRSEHELA